jgi:hypothetical protein
MLAVTLQWAMVPPAPRTPNHFQQPQQHAA